MWLVWNTRILINGNKFAKVQTGKVAKWSVYRMHLIEWDTNKRDYKPKGFKWVTKRKKSRLIFEVSTLITEYRSISSATKEIKEITTWNRKLTFKKMFPTQQLLSYRFVEKYLRIYISV